MILYGETVIQKKKKQPQISVDLTCNKKVCLQLSSTPSVSLIRTEN